MLVEARVILHVCLSFSSVVLVFSASVICVLNFTSITYTYQQYLAVSVPFLIISSVLCNIFLHSQYIHSISESTLLISFSYIMYTIFTDVTLYDTAEEGNVRLVGGANLTGGRVEIFILGQWGTICDYGLDLVEATVVCHQLGYLRAVRTASFGAGSGPSWYRYMWCTGTEMKLTECRNKFSFFGNACTHPQAAGVVCSSELTCLHKY